jgi:hypothetical protein
MVDQPQHLTAVADSDAAGITGVAEPLNLDAIRSATLHTDPWTYAVVTDTFTTAEARTALTDTYPVSGFKQLSQDDDVKQFVMEVRNDITLRDVADPCPWQSFLRQVHGPAYRDAMQQLTGLDLSDAILKVAFYRYPPNAWFGPHRDDERKLISHIFYCNPEWPDGVGGRLLINGSNDMTDVHSTVTPLMGTSVAVVRSDASWHSIEPVSGEHDFTRKSFIAHFYKPGSEVDFYDR